MPKPIPYLIALLTFGLFFSAQAQSPQWCQTDQHYHEHSQENPELYAELERQLDMAVQAASNETANKNESAYDDGRTFYIPVVFHFFHRTSIETPETLFGDAQVEAVLKRLNDDFNRRNSDTNDIQEYYTPLRGNANITFVRAQVDPDGNPTDGIVYYPTEMTSSSARNTDNDVKYLSYWPKNPANNKKRYLNFWIVDELSRPGVLAFATLPEFVASGGTRMSEDGIIGLYSLFRTNPGSRFQRHALSHEAGHWLGLRHPFQMDGSTTNGCSMIDCKFGGDKICDIPQVDTIYQGNGQDCLANHKTCENEPQPYDNRTNIMDYRYCPAMFSKGQTTRMRGTLVSYRKDWVSWENLQSTGIDRGVEKSDGEPTTSIYPNPFSNKIVIEIDAPEETTSCIEIRDLLGRAAFQDCKKKLLMGSNTFEISATDMNITADGVYILEIQTETYTISRRIQFTGEH